MRNVENYEPSVGRREPPARVAVVARLRVLVAVADDEDGSDVAFGQTMNEGGDSDADDNQICLDVSGAEI